MNVFPERNERPKMLNATQIIVGQFILSLDKGECFVTAAVKGPSK